MSNSSSSKADRSRRSPQQRKSKRRDRPWSYGCKSGKQMFKNRATAESQMRKINERGGPHLRELKRAYLCHRCGQWHLTSWE